jgi:hypothetical protein
MTDDKIVNAEAEMDGQPVVKTQKQLEKEAAKAAKLAKLQQKQATQAAQQAVAPKEKVEVGFFNIFVMVNTFIPFFSNFIEKGQESGRCCV